MSLCQRKYFCRGGGTHNDVAFLPSNSTFSTTFLMNCGRGECLGPPHILTVWLWVSKGVLPVKYFCPQTYFVPVEFHGDHMTAYKDKVKSGHPQFWGYYWI